jgi:hypothetical protein
MKDYIVVLPALMIHETALRALIAQALASGTSLTPKFKKAGEKGSSAGKGAERS